jgi:Tol biopolymer transport system component
VFTSVRDKFGETCFHDCSPNGEIYIANADGTNARRLTEHEASDDSPTWSPDGTQILFVSDRSDPDEYAYELYVMPAEGGTPTRITDSGLDWALDPDWR